MGTKKKSLKERYRTARDELYAAAASLAYAETLVVEDSEESMCIAMAAESLAEAIAAVEEASS